MSRKRKAISLETKLKIIEDVEKSGMSNNDLAKKYNIAKSSISEIMKNKEKFMYSTFYKHQFKLRKGKFINIEDATVKWFRVHRSKNIPISGEMIKEKAIEFAQKLSVTGFKASNGWLEGFKKRHDICFKTISGEKASASTTQASDWVQKFPLITNGYQSDDIFNIDETGLYYKLMPDKTMAFKNDPCFGGKRSKDRLTVLLEANITGKEKLPVLVIGKYKNPRCFKNIRTLPVLYKSNLKAWMTFEEWEFYLRHIDKQFFAQKRKILLIVDNCPSHLEVGGLKSITVKYLPPNSTSLIQPMDQGIIQNFKVFYRKLLIKKVIQSLDDKGILPQFNVFDGCVMINFAWDLVQSNTISNCFKKAWTSDNEMSTTIEENFNSVCFEMNELYWQNPLMQTLNENVDLNEYLTVDENVIVTDDSDEVILRSTETNFDENVDDDSDNEMEVPSMKDVDKHLHSLRIFLSCNPDCQIELQYVNNIERKLEQIRCATLKQKQITDYLKK